MADRIDPLAHPPIQADLDAVAARSYLLNRPEALEDYPFGPDVAVYKIAGKMFATLGSSAGVARINLKCDPDEAQFLRDMFDAVQPGYHMNKTHWNTVLLDGSIPPGEIERMMDASFTLVVKGLKKAQRQRLTIAYGKDALFRRVHPAAADRYSDRRRERLTRNCTRKGDTGMGQLEIGYVNIFVSNFERSLQFYRDILGLTVEKEDAGFGYASFDSGATAFAFAQTDSTELVGRHTGIGWVVADVDQAFDALSKNGVAFESPPAQQPWGGYMAIFKDPDDNLFYLDQRQVG